MARGTPLPPSRRSTRQWARPTDAGGGGELSRGIGADWRAARADGARADAAESRESFSSPADTAQSTVRRRRIHRRSGIAKIDLKACSVHRRDSGDSMQQLSEQTRPLKATSLQVMVVGEEKDLAETLASMLASRGYKVAKVRNGSEMLEASRRWPPDVILLDVGVPAVNGFEAAVMVRKERQLDRAVLIALTDWGTDDHRRTSSATGFDAHLAKPVAADTLLEILERLALHKHDKVDPHRPEPGTEGQEQAASQVR